MFEYVCMWQLPIIQSWRECYRFPATLVARLNVSIIIAESAQAEERFFW